MSRNKGSSVYIVGPSFRTQGGISSVLMIYHNHYKDSLNMKFIPSYSGKSRVKDFAYFGMAVIRIFFLCVFSRRPIFHIHSSTYGSFLRKSIIAILCGFFHKKVILHIHGADFDHFIAEAGTRRKQRIIGLLNAADRLVVLSESWKAFFAEWVPAEKIEVIYNPSATYKPTYANRKNARVQILFLGRIGTRKGAYDLIEAVKKIRHLCFGLDMAGDGEGDAVRKIIDTENLSGIMSVHDWVAHNEVGKWYDKADFLVLPSYAEGLPMSVLEAIGKGLPVVATDVGGIPEAVVDGVNGFIITPGDVEALSEKMKTLICNAALREEMGRNSLKIAGDKFSIEKIYGQLKEMYEMLEYGMAKGGRAE